MNDIERFFERVSAGDAGSAPPAAGTAKKSYLSRIKGSPVDAVRRRILIEFAETGRPPTAQELATTPGMSHDAVIAALAELAGADIIVMDSAYEIVAAYPFSARPTGHRVVLDGRSVHALCAIDALGVPVMLGRPAVIESSCSHCGEPISIVVDGRITDARPGGIAVWFSSKPDCGCVAGSMCPLINFFCSREHLDAWHSDNPDEPGFALSLDQAFEAGSLFFGDFLSD